MCNGGQGGEEGGGSGQQQDGKAAGADTPKKGVEVSVRVCVVVCVRSVLCVLRILTACVYWWAGKGGGRRIWPAAGWQGDRH